MRQRHWIPDYIKGWAILFMIQDHIFETWINQDLLFTPMGSIVRLINNVPAAAVFMLIMGYLAYHSRSTYKAHLYRGLKIFFWGFLLNIGLNFHYLLRILSHRIDGNILDAVLAVDIFYLAGISLVIVGILKRASWHPLLIALLAVLIAAVAPWMSELLSGSRGNAYFLSFLGLPTAWSYFPVFPWLSYSLAGFAFAGFIAKTKPSDVSRPWHFVVLILSLSIGSVGFLLNWNDLAELESYYHHGFLVFIWILGFTLAIVMILRLFPGIQNGGFSAWIQFMGKSLTKIYVIQWLIIGNLASFFFQELGWIEFIFGFILITAASTIISFLSRKKSTDNEK